MSPNNILFNNYNWHSTQSRICNLTLLCFSGQLVSVFLVLLEMDKLLWKRGTGLLWDSFGNFRVEGSTQVNFNPHEVRLKWTWGYPHPSQMGRGQTGGQPNGGDDGEQGVGPNGEQELGTDGAGIGARWEQGPDMGRGVRLDGSRGQMGAGARWEQGPDWGGVEAPIWYPIPLSGTPSPYLVCHPISGNPIPDRGYAYINESPKWNFSLLDILYYPKRHGIRNAGDILHHIAKQKKCLN